MIWRQRTAKRGLGVFPGISRDLIGYRTYVSIAVIDQPISYGRDWESPDLAPVIVSTWYVVSGRLAM